QPQFGVELGVVANDGAAVAERAEVLCGVEAEGAGGAGGPGLALVERGAVRLGTVLDQQQVEFPRNGCECVDVGHLPVEVHGEDGADPGTGKRGAAGPYRAP